MSADLRGCFVTGTDTGVGKTVVAAAIVARLRALGAEVRAIKPLITGLDDAPDPDWPRDHELLARVAGCEPAQVILAGFGPAVSPHLAVELARAQPPTLEWLADGVRDIARAGVARSVTVVEGVGGLLVPLGPDADVRDLARVLGLPLVIAARPGLGTISHTLLTLEAARSAGLTIAGVVLTPWPPDPGMIEHSNRETIARRGEVEVEALPPVARADPELLAAAGAELPLERWLADALPSAPGSEFRHGPGGPVGR